MRRFFCTLLCVLSFEGVSLAADLPVKAAPLSPSPAYNWSGFYIGVNGGAGWGNSSANASLPFLGSSFDLPIVSQGYSGWLGGGTAGFNFQSGVMVFGVEGDFDWASLSGAAPCLTVFNCTVKQDWVGDVAGRIGVTPFDKLLMFAKGGVAFADDAYAMGLTLPVGRTSLSVSASESGTRVGGLLGMGIEYAFFPHWSAKIEYDFIDFGTSTLAFPLTTSLPITGLPTFNAQVRDTESLMRAGLNYKF